MKVIFDFDDVLFNANAFKEFIFSELEHEGISNVREKYITERKTKKHFNLKNFLTTLSFDKETVDRLYKKSILFSKNLANQEMVNLIVELGRDNVFVVSHGSEEFQRDKIEAVLGGLIDTTQVVIVAGSKKEEIRHLCNSFRDEKVIFVDDKVEFLNDLPVSDLPNLKTVLFNHNGLHTLHAEIQDSRKEEQSMMQGIKNDGPRMR